MLDLIIGSVIDPEAAQQLVDDLLDAAEERLFDAQLEAHQFSSGEPGEFEEFDKPRIDAAAAVVNALKGLPHRPLRRTSPGVLAQHADAGDRDAADELAVRAEHDITEPHAGQWGASYRLPAPNHGREAR